MIGAVIKDDLVQNLIIIDEKNIPSMSEALGCEIIDARPYGLCVGDLRTQRGWTRNADGEQIVLELLDEKQYDGYTIATEKATQLEEANATLVEDVSNQALAILDGTDDSEEETENV